MGVRVQDRDWRIATHLYRTRMLTTRQIAELCFEGRFCAAQARLYVLRKVDFVRNTICPGVEDAVWFLGCKTFEILRGDDSLPKYPGPLAPPFVGHLVATNSLYVSLLPLLDNLSWRYRDEWCWIGEPGCHRRFRNDHNGAGLHVLKPDAEVSLPGVSFLIERQTAQARERPEKLHDKVFAYHRFINTLERFAKYLQECNVFSHERISMNAYSKDLRLKVLAAVERGVPRREISELVGISISTISRYVKLKASGEDVAPKPSPGRKAKILDVPDYKKALWEQLEENDTATLEEHCEMFESRRGVWVSVATMSRAVRKLGWSFKKDHWEPPKEMSKEEALSGST